MAWSSGLDLETIKSIGHSRGATVNDVLLSAMTGALRRFLAEAGEPVDEFTIRAIIPVNLRPVRSIEEMDDSMGNRFGLVFLDLPVHEKTTEARFRGLKERMDAMKGTPEAFVAFGILNALGHTSATIEHIVNDVFGRKAGTPRTSLHRRGAASGGDVLGAASGPPGVGPRHSQLRRKGDRGGQG
jgi:hypothetical protein